MIQKIKNSLRVLNSALIPSCLSRRLDAEIFGIVDFMQFASKEVNPSDIVLDAGAGSAPYKKYFSHAHYESTDFEDIFDQSSKTIHDFICTLDDLPKPDASYDAIINTQVLEHVEYPQKVIDEFFRVLKPGGKLFLTAPQGWGVHGAPYHFFNFTKYGLESLFKNAGFRIVFIKARGGMFWYLGKRIKTVPFYIFAQFLYQNGVFRPRPLALVLLPIYLCSLPICLFIIPLLCFYLDRLDKAQDFTLGYSCYCLKVLDKE